VGISQSVGIYYFEVQKVSSSACNASEIKGVSAFSTTGFDIPSP